MALGRENVSVTRAHGGANVFGLAEFLRDDDLISHDGSFWEERPIVRTYGEQRGFASPQGHSKNPSGDECDGLGAVLAEVFARLGYGKPRERMRQSTRFRNAASARAPARTRQRSSSIDTSRT